MYRSIVQTVRVSMSCDMASSAVVNSAIDVTTRTVHGTFFSYTTGTKVACLRSNNRWWIWPSMAVGSAIRPVF